MALRITQKNADAIIAKWLDFDSEISFKLAPLTDDNYRIAMERARRLIAREDAKHELSTVSANASDCNEQDVQCNLLGKYIVKEWRGPIEDAQGKRIEYTPDSARELLRCNPDLLVWVIHQSAQIAADYSAEVVETLGKPSSASGGKPSGRARAPNRA